MTKLINRVSAEEIIETFAFTENQEEIFRGIADLATLVDARLFFMHKNAVVLIYTEEGVVAMCTENNLGEVIESTCNTAIFNAINDSIKSRIRKAENRLDELGQYVIYADYNDFLAKNEDNFGKVILPEQEPMKSLLCPITDKKCTSVFCDEYLKVANGKIEESNARLKNIKTDSLSGSWKQYNDASSSFCRDAGFDGTLREYVSVEKSKAEWEIETLTSIMESIDEKIKNSK